MRGDPSDTSRLVEAIYEAACDAACWPEVLDSLADETGSLCATYSVWDRRNGQRSAMSQRSRSYWSPPEFETYYARIDPRLNFAQIVSRSVV